MSSRRVRNPLVAALVIALLLSTAVAVAAVASPSDFVNDSTQSSAPTTCEPTTAEPTTTESTPSEQAAFDERYPATVTICDENGTVLGTVNASVADDSGERHTGLSDTDVLPRGYGMLFVYDDEATRAFVMREMNFPLDMVFVGADGKINAIHHAPVPQPGVNGSDLTRYEGDAKWVLEVPCHWTDDHNVTVGDEVAIER